MGGGRCAPCASGRLSPVPKTLRKLRNPTTAVFCDSRNWCSEYSAFRNTSGSGKSAGTPRSHSCTGRNHFWPATQSARNELLGRMAVIDQTTGCDHVGNHQFDLSGILLRPPAGNAKHPSPRQPRVKVPLFLPQMKRMTGRIIGVSRCCIRTSLHPKLYRGRENSLTVQRRSPSVRAGAREKVVYHAR